MSLGEILFDTFRLCCSHPLQSLQVRIQAVKPDQTVSYSSIFSGFAANLFQVFANDFGDKFANFVVDVVGDFLPTPPGFAFALNVVTRTVFSVPFTTVAIRMMVDGGREKHARRYQSVFQGLVILKKEGQLFRFFDICFVCGVLEEIAAWVRLAPLLLAEQNTKEQIYRNTVLALGLGCVASALVYPWTCVRTRKINGAFAHNSVQTMLKEEGVNVYRGIWYYLIPTVLPVIAVSAIQLLRIAPQ